MKSDFDSLRIEQDDGSEKLMAESKMLSKQDETDETRSEQENKCRFIRIDSSHAAKLSRNELSSLYKTYFSRI